MVIRLEADLGDDSIFRTRMQVWIERWSREIWAHLSVGRIGLGFCMHEWSYDIVVTRGGME